MEMLYEIHWHGFRGEESISDHQRLSCISRSTGKSRGRVQRPAPSQSHGFKAPSSSLSGSVVDECLLVYTEIPSFTIGRKCMSLFLM